jgi:hypothetical protein
MGSAKNVGELFDDFVASFSAGGDPDVLDYLTRAGARRAELATLLDAFLAAAAPPEPSEEKVAAMRAWIAGQPPLLDLRVRRGLKAEAVVERLRELLVLPARALGALRVAYHELETGLLDPAGVDRSVWDALREILGANVRDLAALRPAPPAAAPAFRASAADVPVEDMPLPALESGAETDEEVDRLFRGPR